jgi:hypothetical protein
LVLSSSSSSSCARRLLRAARKKVWRERRIKYSFLVSSSAKKERVHFWFEFFQFFLSCRLCTKKRTKSPFHRVVLLREYRVRRTHNRLI